MAPTARGVHGPWHPDGPGHLAHLEPPPRCENSLEVPEELASSLGWPPAGPAYPEVGHARDGSKGVPHEEELR
eukprot:13708035-Alexandrium_andersonii.AAC.1